jgi:hypothetical protein
VIFLVTISPVYCGDTATILLGRLGATYGWKLNFAITPSHHNPDHDNLRVGTLNAILSEVADYLKMDRSSLAKELFER